MKNLTTLGLELDTLLGMTDDIMRELDAGNNSGINIIALNKAIFSHDLYQLHFVRCSNDAIDLLSSFLSGR